MIMSSHYIQGHRTYPAFLHFLTCLTLLALYIAVISISALRFAFNNPLAIVGGVVFVPFKSARLISWVQDEFTPIHEMLLSLAGIIFTLVIGSFLLYHIYLVSYVFAHQ
jgi:hypothetical protein